MPPLFLPWSIAKVEEGEPTRVNVIVGLGNPGLRYQHTRHNIGFDVIDVLACHHGIPIQHHVPQALCGQGQMGRCAVLLVKPRTYMNASGKAVAPLVHRYMQAGEQLVVIHDDIDLSLGRIKIKRQGGDAGHLGVRSIIAYLGHGTFVRVRMGIGRPPCKADVVDYVLSPFTAAEAERRRAMIAQATACVTALLESAA
jgi:PTH1 family peptidyl-tRNA hydrolase